MSRKDFSDYFAAAYGTGGFDTGMKLSFEKWKAERELVAEEAKRSVEIRKQLGDEQISYLKQGFTPSGNLQNMDAEKANKYIAGSKGKAVVSQFSGIPYVQSISNERSGWVFDPVTREFLKSDVPIMKGDVVRNAKIDPVQQKAGTDLNSYISSASDVVNALDKLESYASKLPEFKEGVGEQAKARVQTAVGTFAADPRFTEYEGVLNTELIPLARKLQEEKGPIAEADVEKVKAGLGKTFIPFNQRQKILGESRQKVRNAIETKLKSANRDIGWLKNAQPELWKKLYTQKISHGGKTYNIPIDKVAEFKKSKGIK